MTAKITRFHGNNRGRCRAVVHGGLVYAVATDTKGGQGLEAQTRNTLATIEALLDETGSAKSRLVQATVYLRDMADKPAMDAIWCDWIGPPENWPQRACVGADLAGGDLIEVVVTAALRD
ncbi:RidA family protein [Marimonas arenosa]|uniref:RidA family protein n=1 Tax=Marimonas arenosa TaxID=1795305 RepID=A0AAE3WC69_9RHOB|nr:RidA family protein [Marimonas arenosa]MDQ2089005.1 RidA family protein [Marimonas arenosa]